MATLLMTPGESEPSRTLLLTEVTWDRYGRLLRDIEAAGQRLYLTYSKGNLELMPPLPTHGRWIQILRWLVEAVSDELNIPAVTYGSTTFRREDLDQGLEPDCCFYVQHARQMMGKSAIDLAHDPPPDLAIEVDVTHRSIDRQPIYAALGVPELWRFDLREIQFLSLQTDYLYQPVSRSMAFPFLDSAEAASLLSSLPRADDSTLRRTIRQWVRNRLPQS